jgi:fatty acid desaturase
VLLVRFLALAPLSFLFPPLHRWLLEHFSSLTINVSWRREITRELSRSVQMHTAAIFAVWGFGFVLMARGAAPARALAVWLTISALVSFVNTMRTLGAHEYESEGDPLDRAGQVADSIDTPGAFWTELWAPVGLRYHALHHYFPGIPYHSLPAAWKRLSEALPPDALFNTVQSPSLAHSLRTLYLKGRGRHGAGR